MTDDKGSRQGAAWLLALAFLALLLAAGFGIRSLMQGDTGQPRKPPKVSLLPSTPPPPPPPPKEEKRPEPPKEVRENKVVEAPEQKDESPPDQSLKMEGAAGDGPSVFGSGKVNNEDLSKIGGPGSGKGGTGVGERRPLVDPFAVYAGSMKTELQRLLARRDELRRRRYGVEVHIWVGDDGRVARFELVGSTEDDETDAAIRKAITGFGAFAEPPPARMPQPVRLRIASNRA